MTAKPLPDPEQAIADDLVSFRYDPYRCALYSFPWGEGTLRESQGPRQWQKEVLEYIGKHLSDPATRYTPCRVAVASGHGIGKTAEIAMLLHACLSPVLDCKAIITANTGTQLATKTVPETSKWFRQAINSHWWTVNATSIRVKDAKHEKTWRADFIPWSEENPQAFAGLHNKGSRVVVIFDEASEIADVIWETAEGAMTDEETEIIWLAFGNPTQNTGRFRECFGKYAHRWKTFQIDSRQVEGTNKKELQQWVEDYGEDSDFVRVRVRGEFPRAGFNQFIPSDVVAACRKYVAQGYERLPKVLSVDVARFGDDQTVLGERQGRKARILKRFRGLDTVQVAERVIEAIQEAEKSGYTYDAVIVDGDGLGAGVIDHLKHRGFGRKLFEFHGGTAANDVNAYFNRRAEVWGLMRDALKDGMEIPDDAELADDLTSPQYGITNKQQIQLERKQDMKGRGLRSPDAGDMLAMTFAVQIQAPKTPEKRIQQWERARQQAGWMQG